VRIIHKTKNTLPLAREKFHNEIVASVCNGEAAQIRAASAMGSSLWALSSSSGIKTVCGEVIDISISFSKLGIAPGDVLEFLFVNANYGVNDFYLPNDMLLTLRREA
jgi:hypothetical protein